MASGSSFSRYSTIVPEAIEDGDDAGNGGGEIEIEASAKSGGSDPFADAAAVAEQRDAEDAEFFSSGVIAIDEDNADGLVRACSAIRLRLRQRFMTGIPDDQLESGEVDLDALAEPVRKAFMGYLFLATVQELIIQHLDSSILDR